MLIEGVEVITQAKQEKQRAGQTQQASFIEMFICLSAIWKPYALLFLQASDHTQTHTDY